MRKNVVLRIIISVLFAALLGCAKEEDEIEVRTNAITQIGITRVSGDATVIIGKDAICLDVGICWDTITNPSRTKNYIVQGSGAGDFSFSIRELKAETEYFVRAYARGLKHTYYGNQLKFRTEPPTVPSLYIDDITDITPTSAITGGYIFDGSGAEITARGVCWSSKIKNALLQGGSSVFRTHDGAGNGNFISQLTGLEPNTTYYVRAYAINKAGAGYSGEIKQFTTN